MVIELCYHKSMGVTSPFCSDHHQYHDYHQTPFENLKMFERNARIHCGRLLDIFCWSVIVNWFVDISDVVVLWWAQNLILIETAAAFVRMTAVSFQSNGFNWRSPLLFQDLCQCRLCVDKFLKQKKRGTVFSWSFFTLFYFYFVYSGESWKKLGRKIINYKVSMFCSH